MISISVSVHLSVYSLNQRLLKCQQNEANYETVLKIFKMLPTFNLGKN